MSEMTIEESVVKAMELFEARQAEKAAKAVALANEEKAAKYDKLMSEKEKEETWAEEKKSVHIKTESKVGFADEDKVMFDRFLRGKEDISVARKALQEDSATEGGVLVPADTYSRMIELRDQMSWPRRMGVTQITTQLDNIDIPAEATSFTKFARTAEEGAYGTNDPAFAQNNVIPQKWTKVTKVSQELMEDNTFDLEGFLMRGFGRAMAQTENYYCAIGSGTNQHEGIFEGGDTNALTFDSSGNITADEIIELFYTLGAGYRGQAAWLMDDQTWRYILSIRDSNNWAFLNEKPAMPEFGSGQPDGYLLGKPVFLDDNIPVITTATCVIMVGDPAYYALVDRKGLVVERNPYLYQANGQVGFFGHFRQSGKVLYELAWVGGLMA